MSDSLPVGWLCVSERELAFVLRAHVWLQPDVTSCVCCSVWLVAWPVDPFVGWPVCVQDDVCEARLLPQSCSLAAATAAASALTGAISEWRDASIQRWLGSNELLLPPACLGSYIVYGRTAGQQQQQAITRNDRSRSSAPDCCSRRPASISPLPEDGKDSERWLAAAATRADGVLVTFGVGFVSIMFCIGVFGEAGVLRQAAVRQRWPTADAAAVETSVTATISTTTGTISVP